jgi:AraC-like DNA-binding protein
MSSRIVRLCLLRLRKQGGDVGDFVRRYGVREDWDSSEDVPMTLPAFRRFVDEVAQAVGDPEFGVSTALATPRGAYGIFEYVARHEATFGDAARSVVRYSAAFNGVVKYSLETVRDEAVFDLHVPGDPECMGRHGNEFAVVIFLKTAREVLPEPLWPRRAWFAHPATASHELLRKTLGVTPEFGATHSGFAMDARLLGLALTSSDPALREILTRQAQEAVAALAPAQDFVARVRGLIADALPRGTASTERIATTLHMSGRTLQRRLKDQDTSFEAVLDEVRQAQSMSLLKDPKLSLGEISFLLGYADQATFTRAFKRWTGKPPGEVRRAG